MLVARALWGETAGALAGGAAFVGHLFPVWLGFKGGKGVATALGIMLAAAWPVAWRRWSPGSWLHGVFRISSLSALVAAVLSPLYARLFHVSPPVLWLILFAAVLVLLRHRPNIARLMRGQEPKVGGSRASTPCGLTETRRMTGARVRAISDPRTTRSAEAGAH